MLKLFCLHRRWHVIANEERDVHVGKAKVGQQQFSLLAIIVDKHQRHLHPQGVIYCMHQAWGFVLSLDQLQRVEVVAVAYDDRVVSIHR